MPTNSLIELQQIIQLIQPNCCFHNIQEATRDDNVQVHQHEDIKRDICGLYEHSLSYGLLQSAKEHHAEDTGGWLCSEGLSEDYLQ